MSYYVHDEYDDRPVAGPFPTANEAAVALRDPAYPFTFEYGPAVVVGDLAIVHEDAR